jgi:hypothetical protein
MEGGGGGFGTLELFAVANLRIRNKEFFISFSYKERFSLFATVFLKMLSKLSGLLVIGIVAGLSFIWFDTNLFLSLNSGARRKLVENNVHNSFRKKVKLRDVATATDTPPRNRILLKRVANTTTTLVPSLLLVRFSCSFISRLICLCLGFFE